MGFGIPFACFLATTLLIMSAMPCHAQLSSTFYDSTCPTALTTIRTAVRDAVSDERRAAAWFLRIHFHDCFVQGCDASVLIDPSSSSTNERNSTQNFRSIRGLELIDSIKSEVENVCPGVVSCADILAVAARDASVEVGGPTWTVKLGRRDSTSAASQDQAQADLPIFSDNLDTIISKFSRVGLSARDMVALSGAHTIGQAQCATFRDRIHNATNIDDDFASTRRGNCPSGNDGNTNLAPLDLETPNSFDNDYFKNLLDRKGLLASDQALFNGGSTDDIVTEYSKDGETFNSDFAAAMVKMGHISPLTGSSGQIRRVCNVVS